MIYDRLSKGVKLALCLTVIAYIGLIGSASQAATLNTGFSYDFTANELVDGNANGLTWLNLNQSTNRSYNDVSGEFGAGGDFEGYRYATGDEINTLISNWVGYAVTGTSRNYHNDDLIDDLISYLGDTYQGGIGGILNTDGISLGHKDDLHFIQGITATANNHSDGQLVATLYDWIETDNQMDFTQMLSGDIPHNSRSSFIGSYLIRTQISVVPLPAAFPLYGAGVAIMGFIGWRRKRKA